MINVIDQIKLVFKSMVTNGIYHKKSNSELKILYRHKNIKTNLKIIILFSFGSKLRLTSDSTMD